MVSMLIQLLSSSPVTVVVDAQRAPDPCFTEDFLRRCNEMERPDDGLEPSNVEEVCYSIVIDYFDKDDELVYDENYRVEIVGNIPSNSLLCDKLKPAMPCCYWCADEVPCFEVLDELTCEDAGDIDLREAHGKVRCKHPRCTC